jgi:hypothetical protein
VKQRKPAIAIGIAALLLGSAISVSAATAPLHLTGSIGGTVRNAAGVVQMGANVILYNRYDRVVEKVTTNADGTFAFTSLLPDLYSLRVTLASFIPAFKQNIAVKPGFHSVLTINMASMLSSIEFVSSTPAKGSLMSDDWKWVLRSSQATRPVLRYRDLTGDLSTTEKTQTSVFSETRGIVKVSAGDATSFVSGPQPDLGTAFALATSIFGSNQLELAGNFGVSAQAGLPSGGFRATYVRSAPGSRSPAVTVGMDQISLPTRGGFGPSMNGEAGAPAMRSMMMSIIDELEVMDHLRLEYGGSIESVSLVNRVNVLSPFARLTYDMGDFGSVRVAYSSGAPAAELAARGVSDVGKEGGSLNRDLATAFSTVPRLAMRNGQVRAQRNQDLEIGYTKVVKSRTYSAGVYKEQIKNGALMLAGADGMYASDVLPDLGSRTALFSLNGFSRWGYIASVAQRLGDRLELGLAYGRGGALSAENRQLVTDNADELRGLIQTKDRNWASGRIAVILPGTGTRVAGSYGWADYRSLMPTHLFLAERFTQDPGLNITIHQPLPAIGLVPGRFEATAELRNLLEQGYLPVTTRDGRTMVLTNAPRAVRGGLSFIF